MMHIKDDDFEQFFVFLAALFEEKEKIENIFLQLQHKQKKIFPSSAAMSPPSSSP